MRLNDSEFYAFLLQHPPVPGEDAQTYYSRVGDLLGISWKYAKKRLYNICKKSDYEPGMAGLIRAAKKVPPKQIQEQGTKPNWREIVGMMQQHQGIKKRLSKSDYEPVARIQTSDPICLVFLSDLHIGSSATDYDLFKQITRDLLEIPNLYAILGGDEVDFAIKLRGVKEVFGDIIDPEMQLYFLESWFEEVGHKIVAAVAGNHDAWRTEQATGLNPFRDIFARKVPYSSGICRLSLTVGDVDYELAFSHTFKGNSIYNPVHSLKRHAREEAPECDLYFAGHNHKPGKGYDWEHGKARCYINSGSIQVHSGYAKRFHSLRTMPVYPCAVLWPDTKRIESFTSVKSYLDLVGRTATDQEIRLEVG